MVGSSTLSLITLNRLFGIGCQSSRVTNLRSRSVYIILAGIWVVALTVAGPTALFRQYWIRGWADVVEVNCDDGKDLCPPETYALYWLLLISITVWIPSAIMLTSFGFFVLQTQTIDQHVPLFIRYVRHQM